MGKIKHVQCAFCPAPADSGEHIWSAWASRLLGAKNRYKIVRSFREKLIRSWKSVGLNEKAPVVCTDCNNGWMSGIETRALPILADAVFDGTPRRYSSEEIKAILIYGCLKHFVSDYHHTYETGRSFHSPAERAHFREALEIPVGTQSWIAVTGLTHGVYKGAYSRVPMNVPDRFEFYVSTLSLGRFVIQVLNVRWCKKSKRRYAKPPHLTQSCFWAASSLPIWPAASFPVCWPPPHALPSNALEAYVDRWQSVSRA
jgi:hypothetical protein